MLNLFKIVLDLCTVAVFSEQLQIIDSAYNIFVSMHDFFTPFDGWVLLKIPLIYLMIGEIYFYATDSMHLKTKYMTLVNVSQILYFGVFVIYMLSRGKPSSTF